MNLLAGYAGLAGFVWLALFQLGLAAGLPIGRLAWGGTHRVLPGRLRAASLASAALAAFGALTLAQAMGLGPSLLPEGLLRPVLFSLAGLFALSTFANLFGANGAERLHGAPLALLLALVSGHAGWSLGV